MPTTEQSDPATRNLSCHLGDMESASEEKKFLYRCTLLIASHQDAFVALATSAPLSITSPWKHFKTTKPTPRVAILLSGCGTSGRIAYLLSKVYSTPELPILYSLGGGDPALWESIEIGEDDEEEGRQQWKDLTADFDFVLFIGISCGLSAPFVASQLRECLADPDRSVPIVIGFNSADDARQNFAQLLHTDTFATRGTLINPIIGPEPLTGSSRMKGGAITLTILSYLIPLLVSSYHNKDHSDILDFSGAATAVDWLAIWHRVKTAFCQAKSVLSQGETLLLQPIASEEPLISELTEMVTKFDVAECWPTYSVTEEHIRVVTNPDGDFFDNENIVQIPLMTNFRKLNYSVSQQLIWNVISTKIFLHIFTTILFTSYGRVYSNEMIAISADGNSKLAGRAIRIIAAVSHCGEEIAEIAMNEAKIVGDCGPFIVASAILRVLCPDDPSWFEFRQKLHGPNANIADIILEAFLVRS